MEPDRTDGGFRLEWLDARWVDLQPVLQLPHWGALGFGLMFVLFWTRLGPRVRFFRVGAWLAALVGVALFPLTVLWVQPELEKTARDLMIAFFDQPTVYSRPLTTGLALVLVRAAGQEALQIIGIVFVLFLLGFRGDLGTALGVGIGVAIGFGLYQSQLALSPVLSEGITGSSVMPIVRGLFLVGAHLGTGLMLGRAWVEGRYVRYFLMATVLHGALGYAGVLLVAGWTEVAALVYFAAIGMLAFVWGAAVGGARLR